jgi:inner membrane transporter RhtA
MGALSPSRIPPVVFAIVSAVFHYLGPAFAVLLFAQVDVLGVAWLRIASAALILALWRRPWRLFLDGTREMRSAVYAFGIVLGLMNACFYLAISRLPLATVGTIEFLGPVVIAAVGIRTLRNLVALGLAVAGGGLLTRVQLSGQPLGLFFAFANCALFMLYVVLGHRVAAAGGRAGFDRLAASMLVAFLVISPMGFQDAQPAFTDSRLLLAGVAVGLCSSVIPYITDQLAMARLPRATFALMLSLLPATAVVMGALVLRQIPTPVELVGILLVTCGVAAHQPGFPQAERA